MSANSLRINTLWRFKVVSLNVYGIGPRWFKRRQLIARELAELDPDLIGFNELPLGDEGSRWIQDELSQRYGLAYDLHVASTMADASARGREGEGFLTRWHAEYTDVLKYKDGVEVALSLRIPIDSLNIDCFLTHLNGEDGLEHLRRDQSGQLIDWIGYQPDSDLRIVMGDFNSQPGSWPITDLERAFNRAGDHPTAFTALPDKRGVPTRPESSRLDRCVDHIFYRSRNGIKLAAQGTCFHQSATSDTNLWPSDHIGLFAEFQALG